MTGIPEALRPPIHRTGQPLSQGDLLFPASREEFSIVGYLERRLTGLGFPRPELDEILPVQDLRQFFHKPANRDRAAGTDIHWTRNIGHRNIENGRCDIVNVKVVADLGSRCDFGRLKGRQPLDHEGNEPFFVFSWSVDIENSKP
jgi:hypothetical protein